MVKKLFFVLMLSGILFAENSYERNCVHCHKKLSASLQEMFKRYLLVYSSEANVKAGIKHYLKYPSKDITRMSDLFIDVYGIKNKSNINDKELDEAVDIYWDKMKVFGKLK